MGCCSLAGKGRCESPGSIPGSRVRPCLQHRSTAFVWQFSSGHKVGNYRGVWCWVKNLCEACTVTRAVIGVKAPWHPENPHLKWNSCLLGRMEWLKLSCAGRTALRMNVSQSLDQCPPSSPSPPHAYLFLNQTIKQTAEKHVCCQFCVSVKCLAINRKPLWPHLATYERWF